MMLRFFCIGDDETVRGFALAGVDGQVVLSAAQAADELTKACSRTDCGIVFITQQWASAISTGVEGLRFARELPLIAEIPGPAGPLPGRKSLGAVAQEAVGIALPEGGEEA